MPLLYISFGSNLGPREENIRRAARLLARQAGPLKAMSALRETQPLGFDSPHPFLNAAAIYETELPAGRILEITQDIERQLGRIRKTHDGQYHDRTIDIDILDLAARPVRTPSLQLPHPRMHQRRFVLEPLCEIAPEAVHPTLGQTYAELLDRLNRLDIRPAIHADPTTAQALSHLLPQLSPHAGPLSADRLQQIISSPAVRLYIGYDETGAPAATFTLTLTPIPTGLKAWVEDLVVDARCRRRGYGRQLIRFAIDQARTLGARSLNLTSRPARQSANALYLKAGFQLRETNVYRLNL